MPEGNHTRGTRSPHSAARTMSEHQVDRSKSAEKSWDELEYEMQFGPLVIEMERRDEAGRGRDTDTRRVRPLR